MSAVDPSVTDARPTTIPLSLTQRRLWAMMESNPAGSAHNISLALRLGGDLDRSALVTALRDVADRHEILRTIFPAKDGRPHQRVLAGVAPALTQVPCTEDELASRLSGAAGHRFDLSAEIPFRAWLFALAPDDAVLLLVVHRIAADDGSSGPLTRDLCAAYAARICDRAPRWAGLTVRYADHALAELARFDDVLHPASRDVEQLDFWRTTLRNAPEELVLPTDRPRPTTADLDSGLVELLLDEDLHSRLLGLARSTGTTLLMVVHTALAATLSSLGAGTDVLLGTAPTGCDTGRPTDVVGPFDETTIIRTDLSGRPRFREVLRRVREAALAAAAHDDVPFLGVIGALGTPPSTGRHPLVQVMVAGQDGAAEAEQLGDLETTVYPVARRSTEFDLLLRVREITGTGWAGGVRCALEYRRDLFDHSTASALARRLRVFLAAGVDSPDRRVTTIEALTTQERMLAVVDHGRAGESQPVHTSFERWAHAQPGAVALVAAAREWTATELNTLANQLAGELASRGIGPDDRVTLLMPRGAAAIISMLAVHKAGAAFVQIDPATSPVARVAAIVEEAGSRVTLTLSEVAAPLVAGAGPDVLVLDDPVIAKSVAGRPTTDLLDTDRLRPLYPEDAAYVLYTSGSTGRPKGVVVEHRNLANLFRNHQETVFGPHLARTGRSVARVASTASLAFDGSWVGLLWMFAGHQLHLVDNDLRRDPVGLTEYVRSFGVDFLDTSPTYAHQLSDAGLLDVSPPATLALGGEAVPPALWQRLRATPGLEGLNLYGPTECTVDAMQAAMADHPEPGLGCPVRGAGLRVLDVNLRPTPVDVLGELYLTGSGLARGYLGNPGATAERFVADPFGTAGARMYRTGDLVRTRADGTLSFAGRSDDQIKIRGVRIEPGEVEAVLSRHPGVGAAAVVSREDRPGDQRLVAYVVAHQAAAEPTPSELRSFVADRCPGHLVPSAVVLLEALPRTPIGKLDRAALPRPGLGERAGDPSTPAPGTARERLLCEIFAQVLGVERIGVSEDFFELGGHSLLAVQLVRQIRSALDVEIEVQHVFQASTVTKVSALVEDGTTPAGSAVLLPLGGSGDLPPLLCVHPVTGISWCYAGLTRHLGGDRAVFGLQSRAVDPAQPLYRDLDEMVDEYTHHIRVVQPTGPYHLLGWSLGGNVAHAVAARLQRLGERVDWLGLMDSDVPGDRAGPPLTTADVFTYVAREGPFLVEPEDDLCKALTRAANNCLDLVSNSAPAVFSGGVSFFTAIRDRPEEAPGGSDWSPYVTGDITDYSIDCAHLDMTRPEPLSRIAKIISASLIAPGRVVRPTATADTASAEDR
jgi:amino acid adenylation domain-containing protein